MNSECPYMDIKLFPLWGNCSVLKNMEIVQNSLHAILTTQTKQHIKHKHSNASLVKLCEHEVLMSNDILCFVLWFQLYI